MSEQSPPPLNRNQLRGIILAMMAIALSNAGLGIGHVVDALESGRSLRLVLGSVMIASGVIVVGAGLWILLRNAR
jgi:hypothetical protein